MNVEAVVLYLLLKSESVNEALVRYGEIKREYFSPSYTPILLSISKFYEDHGKIPTLGELKLKNNRSQALSIGISALEALDIPDITDFDLAVETLKDQYTQQQFLSLISKSLDDIALKTSAEIMDTANAIPVLLEDMVKPNSYLHTAKDITVFESKEDSLEEVTYTGISNRFDAEYGATRRGEVFLIGGRKGAGKSVICANIAAHGVNGSELFVPYFSIEMSAKETLMRYLGMLAGVPALKIRNKTYEIQDLEAMAMVRASMFENGEEILRSMGDLVELDDFVALEQKLTSQGVENQKSGIIIIDDPEIKISSIDMYLTNMKAKYGNKLGIVIIDYLNQVVADGTTESTMYDWKQQIVVAKKIKALARKHNVTIFSPYQIDESGEARMAKGILDSCDFAFTVEAIHAENSDMGALKWKGAKARGLPALDLIVGINWSTLQIDPRELTPHELTAILGTSAESSEEKPKRTKKKAAEKDLEPWELD